jgi:hypothetical protein
MPIEYGTPINPYVNRGSVEVAKLLSNRFANNLMYSNELEEQLANLQVADFQGDMAAKFALEQQTKKTLDGLATRGDYENLTVPIVRASQDFTEQYAPLQQNYKLYEEAKKMEQERVMRGDITKDQYDNWLRRSKYINDPTTGDLGLYSGVRRRKDGNVDPSSFFQHVPIARAVNVDDEIIKMINTLDPEKRGGRSATSFQTGADGIRYVVDSQGEIIEQITPDRVAAVTRQVLDRSDVRSYLEQEADFNTFEASPEELQMMLRQRQSQLQGKASHANHAREIGAALSSGNTGQMRAMARKILQDQEAERYMDMAIKAGATTSRYGGGFSMKIDTDYYSLISKEGGTPRLSTPVVAGEPQTATNAAAQAGGGTITPTSIAQARSKAGEELRAQRALLLQRYSGKLSAAELSENITAMSSDAIKQKYGALGDGAVADLVAYRNLQRTTAAKNFALTELDQGARDRVGFTQEQAIDDVLINIGNEHGVQADQIGDQILNKISEKYDVSSEDALRIFASNYKNDATNRIQQGLAMATLGATLPSTDTNLPIVLQKVFGIDAADAAKIARETPARSYYLDGIFQTGFAEELNASSINNAFESKRSQYEEVLKESSTTQLAFNTSEHMFGDPSPKQEMSTTLTKSLKDYPPDAFSALTDRRTGQNVGELLGEGAYTISDIKYTHAINPDNTISANAIQMTFKPDSQTEGENKVVVLPYNEVVSNYTYGNEDANISTKQHHTNAILSEVYTRKINNPLVESVNLSRKFSGGRELDLQFNFIESKTADGITFPEIQSVTGYRNGESLPPMSLNSFMDFYIDGILAGDIED